MAKYNVTSGEIQEGYKYIVVGTKSVVYNSVTYNTTQEFEGVTGVATFTFSGAGTEIVNQLIEFKGSSVQLVIDDNDRPIFPEETHLLGFGVEYIQQGADIVFNDETIIKGFAVEFVDVPLKVTFINTRRL